MCPIRFDKLPSKDPINLLGKKMVYPECQGLTFKIRNKNVLKKIYSYYILDLLYFKSVQTSASANFGLFKTKKKKKKERERF